MFYQRFKGKLCAVVLSVVLMMIFSPVLLSKTRSSDIPEKYSLPDKMSLLGFCRYVSQRLDLTIVFSNRIRMNRDVQVIVNDDLSDVKLYNVFFSVLLLHSYAVIRKEDVVRIVRSRRARTMPLRVIDDNE